MKRIAKSRFESVEYLYWDISTNVDEAKERILDLLNKLNIEYDKDVAYEIMNRNIVCSDFFEWDFENWKHK